MDHQTPPTPSTGAIIGTLYILLKDLIFSYAGYAALFFAIFVVLQFSSLLGASADFLDNVETYAVWFLHILWGFRCCKRWHHFAASSLIDYLHFLNPFATSTEPVDRSMMAAQEISGPKDFHVTMRIHSCLKRDMLTPNGMFHRVIISV